VLQLDLLASGEKTEPTEQTAVTEDVDSSWFCETTWTVAWFTLSAQDMAV